MASCGATFTEEKREFEIFPTVVPAKNFDAETDAKTLHGAMKGLGTNESKIISVVAYRSIEQLKEVEKTFKTMFGEDLKKWLKSELSGNLEKVVLGRFFGRFEYLAHICRVAMKGIGTDEEALVDVICSKTSDEINKIKDAYKDMFERDLIKDIESETSGNLRKILVAMATGNRETKKPDIELAKQEAQMLFDAGENRVGTDETVFIQIFATRSPMHLKLVWLLYRKLTGHLIFEALEKELSGKLRLAFITIARYIKDPITYYAEMMNAAMKGLGTNNKRLIRAIVERCEIDLKTVAERYNKLHKTPLDKRIMKETSGDYEKILIALLSC